jgi:anti-sigma B factor antagonist
MKQAIYIDSSSLGMIIKAVSDMRNAGGDIKLAHVSDIIADVLRVTNLDKIIQIYDTVDLAIKKYD